MLIPALVWILTAPAASRSYGENLMIIQSIRQIQHEKIHCDHQSNDYFGYVKGSIPVLISAPHGAKHYRTCKKFWKAEDAYTSALAIELGRLTGAHVLYLKNKAPEDPNNDVHTKYKDFLARVARDNGIKFVIDLHGAGADRPFKVDVGTMSNRNGMSSCPTFRSDIISAFRNFEDHLFNRRFRARGPGTITYFAKHTLGIEAAQIEINARYRMIESDNQADQQNIITLTNCLQSMILQVNQRIQSASRFSDMLDPGPVKKA